LSVGQVNKELRRINHASRSAPKVEAGVVPKPESIQSAVAAGLRYVTGREPGIRRVRRGAGFAYVAPDGKVVRDRGTLDRIRKLAIPPAWTDVWICTMAAGHLQATGRDAKRRKQYRYHTGYREFRNQNKYDKLLDFGAALPRIRLTIRKDLQLPGFPKRKLLAAIVRLLDETCIRIGNNEYAKTNDSYGLTTLRQNHARINGNTIRFRFRGKSGLERDLNITDPQLARIMRRCQDLPGEELFQFQTEAGEFQPIGSADVNEYLREISEQDVTAKDFRTWHGTAQLFRELVGCEPPASESEAKKQLVEAVKATSTKLGNRPATCRNYYVHPAVVDAYMNGTLAQALSSNSSRRSVFSKEEAAVLRLVKQSSRARRTPARKAS
jgi:DNA topoisomerase-1